jgi:hypothetical protein
LAETEVLKKSTKGRKNARLIALCDVRSRNFVYKVGWSVWGVK